MCKKLIKILKSMLSNSMFVRQIPMLVWLALVLRGHLWLILWEKSLQKQRQDKCVHIDIPFKGRDLEDAKLPSHMEKSL